MSKIICDVCGTSYPETATQCPICGCVRSTDSVAVTGELNDEVKQPVSTYTPVKGGRFSKANVKKRNSGKPLANAEPAPKLPSKPAMRREESGSTNQAPVAKKPKKPKLPKQPKQNSARRQASPVRKKIIEIALVLVVILLLIALAGVAIHMACKFLGIEIPKDFSNETQKQTNAPVGTDPDASDPTDGTTPEVTVPQDQRVPCTGITVTPKEGLLTKVGGNILLDVKIEPANCTDKVSFECEDGESIIKVDADGKITAVANGTTSVIVRCGDQKAECLIICKLEDFEDPTPPTDPPETKPTYTADQLTFVDNGWGYDYTLAMSQKSFTVYNGEIPEAEVEFISNNENVVTIDEFGVLTLVGTGSTTVIAKYGEWQIEAKVRVTGG